MKNNRLALYIFSFLVAVYTILNIFLPVDRASLLKYHLSVAQLHLLDVTILLPAILIWILAYVSYVNLAKYCSVIADSKDGQAFKNISLGIMTFAFGLPSAGIITTILKWIVYHNHGFTPTSVIVTNYITLLVPLLAFFLIAAGVHNLLQQINIKYKLKNTNLLIALLTILGSSYTYLTFNSGDRLFTSIASSPNIYYLPSWLILLTIVIPYVYMWSRGLFSVFQIGMYRYHVKGVIYRAALSEMAIGMGVVLFSYVILEYITSLTNRLLHLKIGWLLLIIYCFLAVLGIGYLLIALGARKLRRIEEV